MKKFFVVWGLILFAFFACKPKQDAKPENLLNEQQMVAILIDIQLTEASLNNLSSDPEKIVPETVQAYDSIFTKHHITSEQFKSSYDYYILQEEELKKIHQKVVEGLITRQ